MSLRSHLTSATLLTLAIVLGVQSPAIGMIGIRLTSEAITIDGSGASGFATETPRVDKVDPPSWFVGLPSPMLLIHGEGLAKASFSGAPIRRTITSPNGHWAIVWLDTATNSASTLHLRAHSSGGSTSFEYKLLPRRLSSDGKAGFSPADVMMCIMPDRLPMATFRTITCPAFRLRTAICLAPIMAATSKE